MAKSARSPAQESRRSDWLEPLTDAVNRLTDEIRVARDVADEFRIDFAWLLQNGMPHQPQEFVILKRMARDPLAEDAIEHLESAVSAIRRSHSSELAAEAFDELMSEIAEVVTFVGQEQVNLILSALDDARANLVAAIKATSVMPSASQESTAPPSLQPSTSQDSAKPSETRSLF